MTSKMVKVFTIAGAILFAGNIYAQSCTLPEAVAVPDGTTASTDEMLAGQKAVKEYMKVAEVYLACLKQREKGAGNADDKREIVSLHNKAVDEMEMLAEAFNKQIRAYKTANSGS